MGSSNLHKNQTHRQSNPFQDTSAFNLPLSAEICERISAEAMYLARKDDRAAWAVAHCSSGMLRERIRRYGRESCFLHPAALQQRFQGVTLAVYQTIEWLYCSRLERSIPMVAAIVQAMALQVNAEAPTSEAIWTMCLSLEKRRHQQTTLAIQQDSPCWWIGPLTPLTEEDSEPLLVGVLDLTQKRVLAVQGEEQQQQEQLSALALYEAIVSQRQPEPRETSGLTWHLPVRLYTPAVPSPTWLNWSNVLNVALEREVTLFPFVETLPVDQRQLSAWLHDGACVVSDYSLQGFPVIFSPEEHALGFLGRITYTCRTETIVLRQILTALARFAFFAGVGFFHAQGMGTTRVRIEP